MKSKVLDATWFNDIGIITIDNGFEIKSYIGKTKENQTEEQDTQNIIDFGLRIYPSQLKFILDLYADKK